MLLQANFVHNQKAQKRGEEQGAKKRLSDEEYAEVKRRRKENDLLRKVSFTHYVCTLACFAQFSMFCHVYPPILQHLFLVILSRFSVTSIVVS